jgi:anti-sigma regulatory factor (Ser/Thr protein kinase)
MSQRLGFELSFESLAGLISPARRFVEQTVERAVHDPEDVFRVAMTAHELLENAVKYGRGKVTTLAVWIEPDGAAMTATLRLTNVASKGDIERLQAGVTALLQSTHPNEYYRDLMCRDVGTSGESGLGLARIVVEGEMQLSTELDGDQVTITATGRLRGAAR